MNKGAMAQNLLVGKVLTFLAPNGTCSIVRNGFVPFLRRTSRIFGLRLLTKFNQAAYIGRKLRQIHFMTQNTISIRILSDKLD